MKLIKRALSLLPILLMSQPSWAETWEWLASTQGKIVTINTESIRSFQGSVFAVISITNPELQWTAYNKLLYSCGSRELYYFDYSPKYPDVYMHPPFPTEPDLLNGLDMKFDIHSYCYKSKSKDDIELPLAISDDKQSMTTILLSETKIDGNNVSIWTNNYKLFSKPLMNKGKQLKLDGEALFAKSVNKRAGSTTVNFVSNCSNDHYFSRRFIRYDGNGKVVESYSTPSDKQVPVPRTVGGQIFKISCGFLK